MTFVSMSRASLYVSWLTLAVALWTFPCFAQSDQDMVTARAAAKAAQQAFVDGNYDKSIELFEKAESLVHAPTHLLFIARAHEKEGRLVQAIENYNKIVYEQLPDDAPVAFVAAQAAAKEEVAVLEPRIPTVTLSLAGEATKDFTLLVGGRERPGLADVPQPIDPGTHTLKAVAPGLMSAPVSVTLAEGESKNVTLTMSVDPSAVPAAQAEEPTAVPLSESPPKKKGRALRTVGWISIGVGTAALLTGASTLIASAGNRGKANNVCGDDTCEGEDEDQFEHFDNLAKTFRVPGYLGLGVGVAATGTGIALVAIANKKNKSQSGGTPEFRVGSVGFTPVILPQGAAVLGRF